MAQDPINRDQAIASLSEWMLKPDHLHLQAYIQNAVLKSFKAVVPDITDIALQFRASGNHCYVVFFGDKADRQKSFSTPVAVLDWIAEEQKAKEQREMQAQKKSA